MSAYAYGMLAVISYSLAGVCAVLTAIFFFAKNVRQVRNDLTGRTAERAIADLRQGKGSRSRFFGGEEGGAAGASRNARTSRASSHDASGSLKLRRVSADDVPTTEMAQTENEPGTTILGAAADTETETTVLGAAAGSEDGTTLLNSADESDEGATGLLPDAPRKELR